MAGGPGEGYYSYEGGGAFIEDLYAPQGADYMMGGGAEAQGGQLPDPDTLRRQANERSRDAIQ